MEGFHERDLLEHCGEGVGHLVSELPQDCHL